MDKGFEGASGLGYSGGRAFDEYEDYLRKNDLEQPVFIPLIPICSNHAGYIDGKLEATVDYFIVEKAIELLKKYNKEDKPFFFTLQFWGPHECAKPNPLFHKTSVVQMRSCPA
jgi:hypothetical protein